MRRALGTVALLALSSTARAQGESPLTFKGLPIGAERAEVTRVLPSLECDGALCRKTVSTACPTAYAIGNAADPCVAGLTYGGIVPRSISVLIRDDKLVSAAVFFKATDYGRLVAAIEAGFGAPSAQRSEPIVPRVGNPIPNRISTWEKGGVVLEVAERGLDPDGGIVQFTTEANRAAAAARRRENARKGAKDL